MQIQYTPADVERFWDKVNKNGPVPVHRPELGPCWEWIGGCTKAGYGQAWAGMHIWYAHRLSFYLDNGSLPDDHYICHHCDNPPCVRPTHIFAGTSQQNNDDCRRKGRRAKTKLTWADIVTIRSVGRAASHRDLGKYFGVSHVQIGQIVRGRVWTTPTP